jgi:hypothetical protein
MPKMLYQLILVVGIFKNLNYNIGKQNSVDPKGRTRGK